MKYIVTQGISCGLIIPVGTQLKIDRFTFLSDSEGHLAERIQTEVDAGTKEEARRKARKLFTQFLPKLTLVDNGQYALSGSYSIQEGGKITGAREIHATASVGRDGNFIRESFEKNIQGKRLQVGPLIHYSDGINSSDLFVKYREFYKVLEFYFEKWERRERREKANDWIKGKIPDIAMEKNDHNQDITIISWIRHKLSHSDTKAPEPFSISNPQHVELVQKYLPVVQELAREIIRERENV